MDLDISFYFLIFMVILQLNGNFDCDNKHHIVRMHEYFVYRKHLCISFEMLGSNLWVFPSIFFIVSLRLLDNFLLIFYSTFCEFFSYEVLKLKNLKGLPLNVVQLFSKQVLFSFYLYFFIVIFLFLLFSYCAL